MLSRPAEGIVSLKRRFAPRHQDSHFDARSQARDVLGEQTRRVLKPQAVAREVANGKEGSPVHWNCQARLHQTDSMRRIEWIHMARAKGWPPSRDRHEHDVQRWRQIGHVRKELGVSSEVDRTLAAHKVAEGLSAGAAQASAIVASLYRGHRERADFRNIADT